jgi:hypothetical protein
MAESIALGSNPLVLLGAGASVEAHIPATIEMTERLVNKIGEQPYRQIAQALNFVCAALVLYESSSGASPYVGLDIERVFAAVELLRERRELEVSPFVSSWHPGVDAWDRPSTVGFNSEFQQLISDMASGHGIPDPQRLLERLIDSRTGSGTGETYKQLAAEMIVELRNLVASQPKDVSYLAPLVNLAQEGDGLTIATLNYDLAIEQAAEGQGVQADTGIAGWIKDRRWDWSEHGLRLLKLHGSIDWYWENQFEIGHLGRRTVAQASGASRSDAPVVVFGQRGKLRAEGPFLSLLGEFETCLVQSDRLIVIGYSFRDEHINEALRQWCGADPARTIVLVDPFLPEYEPGTTFRGELVSSLNPTFPKDLPQRVELIKEPASEAVARLRW